MQGAPPGLVIVYNGEIYNHVELRNELRALGQVFRGGSDTEVILAAWEQWGPECQTRFNGMWAFALYDKRIGKVFASRDRFGVKPMYRYADAQSVSFSSEIRQLRASAQHSQAVNSTVLQQYLLTGLSETTQDTFFEGVSAVPPGCWIEVDVATGTETVHRYYRIPETEPPVESGQPLADQLEALLCDSIRLRLRADVRVGTCLSGGLDSSTIAAVAQGLYRGQSGGLHFHAFTAVSAEPQTDETAWAAQVIDQGTFEWVRVRPSTDEFWRDLDTLIATQEEPVGSPSAYMQWRLMQAARKAGVPVLLDGQGADEVLLGYERHYAAALVDVQHQGGWTAALRFAQQALRANTNLSPTRLLTYLMAGCSADWRSRFLRFRYPFLRSFDLPHAIHNWSAAVRQGRVQDMQRIEIESTNLPMLLRYEDRNSMAHSIETRLPFLDYRVVELCLAAPPRSKLTQGWSKYPLRQLAQRHVPGAVAWRRNKLAFASPMGTWLQANRTAVHREVLASRLLAAHVDLRRLEPRLAQIDLGMTWRLLCIARWGRYAGVE